MYKGDRAMVVYNNLLGSINLNGIASARFEISKIDTSLSIDVNGILTVDAVDRQNEISESMLIYENSFI